MKGERVGVALIYIPDGEVKEDSRTEGRVVESIA